MNHIAKHRNPSVPVALPPTSELFNTDQLAARHPHLLSTNRIQWALRYRQTNGLEVAVYECRAGELLIHEPSFLTWFLGLTGRAKPRAPRRAARQELQRAA